MITKRIWAAAFAAAVFLLIYGALALTEPGPAGPIAFRLPALSGPEALDEIVIRRQGKEILLRQQDGAWRLASPVEAAADKAPIEAILSAFREGVRMDLAEPWNPEKAERYGLEGEPLEVTLRAKGKELSRFSLGKKISTNRTFLLPEGSQTVYRAMADLRRLFDKAPEDFRRRVPWEVKAEEIEKITLVSPVGEFRAVRTEEGWKSEDASEPRLDSRAMDSLVRTIASLRAVSFADDKSPEEAGLTGPDTKRLMFTTQGGVSYTLLLGAEDEQKRTYSRLDPEGEILLLNQFTVENLLKPPSHFWDKSLFALNPLQIQWVELRRSSTDVIRLVRSGGGFSMEAPQVQENLRPGSVEEFLQNLLALEATEFPSEAVPDEKSGLSAPFLIAVGLNDGTERTLALGREKEESGLVYARVNTGPLALIPTEDAADLKKTAADFLP